MTAKPTVRIAKTNTVADLRAQLAAARAADRETLHRSAHSLGYKHGIAVREFAIDTSATTKHVALTGYAAVGGYSTGLFNGLLGR